jgi:hypothetical protein
MLPTAALIAGRHYRRHPEFWRLAALERVLGVAGFVAVTVFLVTFFGVSPHLVGATERIAVLVEICKVHQRVISKRCPYVTAEGQEHQLDPDPKSAVGRRALLERNQLRASRVIGAVSVLLLEPALRAEA